MELKPCPFCGEKTNLWQYICPSAAKVECGNCGCSLPKNSVRTIYYLDEAIPEELKPFAKKQKCMKDKYGNIIEAYWICPPDSFRILGQQEAWNTRTEQPEADILRKAKELITVSDDEKTALTTQLWRAAAGTQKDWNKIIDNFISSLFEEV